MLRHAIRLSSVHEGVEDSIAYTTNLNQWLEAFFANALASIHTTRDWGVVSIVRVEVAGPLEPWSDEPPTLPNRVNSIEPFPIGWS